MIKKSLVVISFLVLGSLLLKPKSADAIYISFKCPAGYYYSLSLKKCVKY